MPKFFYSIVVATVLSWLGVLAVGAKLPPDSGFHIILFMICAFLATGITLTTLLFVYLNYSSSVFMNRHILFKRALKYGYFFSLYITGIFTMRAFEVATAVNIILFTVLCIALRTQFKSSRT